MELDSAVQPSVSHTTRPPRGQEKHGREYFFASHPEFDAMVEADAFVEWAHVHGQRYGTSKKAIEERIAQGADVILEIDFQGALQIRKTFANAVMIFILPPTAPAARSDFRSRRDAGLGACHRLCLDGVDDPRRPGPRASSRRAGGGRGQGLPRGAATGVQQPRRGGEKGCRRRNGPGPTGWQRKGRCSPPPRSWVRGVPWRQPAPKRSARRSVPPPWRCSTWKPTGS